MSRITVVLVGTEPGGGQGGIQSALVGIRAALDAADLEHEVVISHRAASLRVKASRAAGALRETLAAVERIRRRGRQPVVYAHAGEWPSMLRKATLLAAARARGARTILQLWAPELEGYLAHRAARAAVRRLLHVPHVVSVPTVWWREQLEPLRLRRPLEVVPNPLPPALEREASRARPGEERDDGAPLRVLALTRLVPGKGVENAIRAVAAFEGDAVLTVAGDGTDRARLEGLARGLLPADRVRFPGWLGDRALQEAYRAADVFCLPTNRDSFGMVLVEAMAHGLPVLAQRWGPIPEVVPDGRAGVLVPEPVVPNLARALERSRDPALRRSWGHGGRRWVIERFGVATTSRTLRRVVERATLP